MRYIKVLSKELISEIKPCFILRFFNILMPESTNQDKECYWYLELNDNGTVNREISFSNKHKIVSKAPLNRDRGLWADSNVTLNYNEYEQIDQKEFLYYWEIDELL